MRFPDFLAVLSIGWIAASPAAADTIRFGITSFPPYYDVDDGKVGGSLLPVLDDLAHRTGRTADIVGLPVNRLRQAIADGEVDAWLTGSQPSLPADTMRTRSLGRLVIKAYWLGDTPPLKRGADLAGRKVIRILGFQYAGFGAAVERLPGVESFTAVSHRDGLAMLAERRGDYLIDYEEPTSASQAELGIGRLESIELQRSSIVIYVSAHAREAKTLFGDLDKAAQEYLAEHGPISIGDGDGHASLRSAERYARALP